MILQPSPREGTPRHNGETIGRRPRNGGTDERGADSSTSQTLGHLGMDENEPTWLGPIHQLGERAVLLDDETLVQGIVANDGRGGGISQRPDPTGERPSDAARSSFSQGWLRPLGGRATTGRLRPTSVKAVSTEMS